jgi:hypothetical protein
MYVSASENVIACVAECITQSWPETVEQNVVGPTCSRFQFSGKPFSQGIFSDDKDKALTVLMAILQRLRSLGWVFLCAPDFSREAFLVGAMYFVWVESLEGSVDEYCCVFLKDSDKLVVRGCREEEIESICCALAATPGGEVNRN